MDGRSPVVMSGCRMAVSGFHVEGFTLVDGVCSIGVSRFRIGPANGAGERCRCSDEVVFRFCNGDWNVFYGIDDAPDGWLDGAFHYLVAGGSH